MTVTSTAMPNDSSVSAAAAIVGRSLSEPMMIPTRADTSLVGAGPTVLLIDNSHHVVRGVMCPMEQLWQILANHGDVTEFAGRSDLFAVEMNTQPGVTCQDMAKSILERWHRLRRSDHIHHDRV